MIFGVAALTMACGTEAFGPEGVPAFAVGDRDNNWTEYTPGLARVCAFYPYPEIHEGTSTFSATATGGGVVQGTFTIQQPPWEPHCVEAWNATDATLVDFTASLVAPAGNVSLDRIVTFSSLLGATPTMNTLYDVTSATLTVSDQIHASVWFKFKEDDTPPPAGEGCTPGYWKQRHHFDSWTDPYDPTDQFASVFADALPGLTLGEVLRLRRGGLNALGRHAVAALLNAASPDVEYDYSVEQVITLFNAAYASADAGAIENQKDGFDFLNNQGCPLD